MSQRRSNTLSRRRSYRNAAFMLVTILISLLMLAPALTLAENGSRTVRVAYIYSPSCSICEHSGPTIRNVVNDSKNAGLNVQYVEYSYSSKEGIGHMERFGLDSVPAVVIDDRVIRFEDFNGDTGKLGSLIRQGIWEASHYQRQVMLERKISRIPEKDTVNVVTSISNAGGEPVYATLRGGVCEGVSVVSGNASWQGLVMPGEKLYHTYEADVNGNVKTLPPQTLVYRDPSGDHFYVGQETPVFLLKRLSMAAVFMGGVVAGINPCLLAVMAFVSAMALSARGRRLDIFFNLTAFCAGLLSIYLLVGIGFLRLIERLPSVTAVLKAGIILLLIALAGFAFYEAYQLKKNPDRPSLFKSFIGRYKPLYNRFSLAANFGLGGAFGLIKMPCVGGIYVAILGAIVESSEAQSGLLYLAAYNLGVVLPVLALGALLALGLSPCQVDDFRKRHRYALKLATGVILVAMAGGFIFNII
jgi:cytochrome c biogenesis protein CcdA